MKEGGGSAASIEGVFMKGAKPPYGDLLRKLRLSPQNVSVQKSCTQTFVVFPEVLHERSLNPKMRNDWRELAISACRNDKRSDS